MKSQILFDDSGSCQVAVKKRVSVKGDSFLAHLERCLGYFCPFLAGD